ncbi:MAG: DUF58 domain-containing protein [Lachnospiraceae bacterium]|nr:DUF58 domain-containing protein [Lachnospiraceae bacterium]
MKLIIAILIGAGLFWIVRLLYKKKWEDGLKVEIDFPDRMVREGEESRLQEVITNDKWLPLPILQVKFAITRTFRFATDCGGDVTDQYYRSEYFALRAYERISRTYPFRCTRRGLFSMKNMDLLCRDLFMSAEMYDSIEHPVTLLVLPRRISLQEIPADCIQLLGEIETNLKLMDDPFAFSMIREYQPYDSMHAVNWKVSARMDELMVNTFHTTLQRELVIFLDLNTHAKLYEERLREDLIRIAATLGAYFVERKIPTALITNGCDSVTGKAESVRSGAALTHIQNIETMLARIDANAECTDILDLIRDRIRLQNHEEFLILTNNRKSDFIENIRELRERSDRKIHLISAYLKRETDMCACDFAYRWEIKDE